MSSEWQKTTLGAVSEWASGGTPKKDEPSYWGGDIPWISANSMQGTRYSDSELKLTPAGLANGSRLVPKGTVLLLVRGSALHTRIPVGIATRSVAFNQDVKALVARKDLVRPWYLLYWLMGRERFFLESVVEYTGIGAGKLDTKRMQALELYLPSLAEQDGVIGAVKALDDRITLLRETNATLEAIAQALFKSWFVDFDPVRAKMEGRAPEGMDEDTATLFPDGFEESALGLVPRGWQLMPLVDAFEMNPSRALRKGQTAPYLDMASVGTSGHRTEQPILREMGSGSKFRNGDTLLARITPCLENGKAAFVDFLSEGEIGWGSTEFLVLHPKNNLPDYFAYLLCKHRPFAEFAIQSMVGTSGRQRIQNDALGQYPVAIPPAAISQAFGQVTSLVQSSIAAYHEQAQTLAVLRDTLLPRLISGQLRLPEAMEALEAA